MNDALDRLPGGYLAFGDDGVVSACNRTLGAMLGMDTSQLIGQHVERLLTVPSRIFYQTHVFPLLRMQGHVEEVYLSALTAAGEEVPVLVNGCRIEQGGVWLNECLVVPMRRRSEFEDEILAAKRQAEAALRERDDAVERLEGLRQTLEHRVADRTAELSALVKELQGFNYSIAHDLRAPLRAIISTCAILMGEAADLLNAEQVELLRRQQANASKLSSLLEDLLRLSRLGLKPLHKARVKLSDIALEAGAIAVADQGRDNLELRIEPGVHAYGDRSMLYVLMANLMENAVKYSPHGGVVEFGSLPSEGRLVCYVRDEGIGIDPVYVHKIFKPFERLHRDEDFPGNGIGLATVERILHRHQGAIWVESTPGRGSCFLFSLPEPG